MKRWQMRRNCALTPKQLLQFYIVLVCISLIVAVGFFLAGAWVIPIFTALELSAVTLGFLIYCRHALDSETIEIEGRGSVAFRPATILRIVGATEHEQYRPAEILLYRFRSTKPTQVPTIGGQSTPVGRRHG